MAIEPKVDSDGPVLDQHLGNGNGQEGSPNDGDTGGGIKSFRELGLGNVRHPAMATKELLCLGGGGLDSLGGTRSELELLMQYTLERSNLLPIKSRTVPHDEALIVEMYNGRLRSKLRLVVRDLPGACM